MKKTTTTTIVAIVLAVTTAIGLFSSSVVVNPAFAGVASGPPSKNPGACHQFAKNFHIPPLTGNDLAQFCKGFAPGQAK